MAITDNRTIITTNDTVTNIDDGAGSAAGNQNTEFFVEGTASTSEKASMSVIELLYDFGSAQDFTDETFYIWWNVSTAGLLETQAAGGVRMRFCGATVTDFFEVYLAGSDTYSGGFTMSVVQTDRAKANADAGLLGGTGGTSPAVSAIRWVGMVYDISNNNVPGNVDNVMLDAMWRLPSGQSGIIVEGSGSGAPFTWDDIVDAGDIGDTTKAWGSIKRENGIIFVNTPIQFGTSGTINHTFADTNEVIAWETQLVGDDLYGFLITGSEDADSITSFSAGEVIGNDDAAVGNQGWVVTADQLSGTRWFFDADATGIDYCKMFGSTLIHGSTASVSSTNVEFRSCLFNDFGLISGSGTTFQRNTVVAANTVDGEATFKTNTLDEVKNCRFVFSDGHAVELHELRIATMSSDANFFTNYGADASNDAAVYNQTSGSVLINVLNSGDSPTVRNGTSADTTVNNPVTFEITGLQTDSEVRIFGEDDQEIDGTESSGTTFTHLYNFVSSENIYVVIFHINFVEIRLTGLALGSTDQSIPVQQRTDRVYSNP